MRAIRSIDLGTVQGRKDWVNATVGEAISFGCCPQELKEIVGDYDGSSIKKADMIVRKIRNFQIRTNEEKFEDWYLHDYMD